MKIVFVTNLDKYRRDMFPDNLVHVPRIGEKVRVKDGFIKVCDKRPKELTVVSVTYTENKVLVELHYSKLDLRIYNKIDLF